mgnify:CR=1 FL=1
MSHAAASPPRLPSGPTPHSLLNSANPTPTLWPYAPLPAHSAAPTPPSALLPAPYSPQTSDFPRFLRQLLVLPPPTGSGWPVCKAWQQRGSLGCDAGAGCAMWVKVSGRAGRGWWVLTEPSRTSGGGRGYTHASGVYS